MGPLGLSLDPEDPYHLLPPDPWQGTWSAGTSFPRVVDRSQQKGTSGIMQKAGVKNHNHGLPPACLQLSGLPCVCVCVAGGGGCCGRWCEPVCLQLQRRSAAPWSLL